MKKNIVINSKNEFPIEKIYRIYDKTNNRRDSLALGDKFGSNIYLTKFYVNDI